MATTYIQSGDVLTFVAPAGGVTSGVPVFIAGQFVIPMVTAAAGANFEAMLEGVHKLTKTGSQAWLAGQKVYWDLANSRCDTDPTVGPFIGFSTAAVDSAAGSTSATVRPYAG
jgi:predicted RecA/RadA family phage recombinase